MSQTEKKPTSKIGVVLFAIGVFLVFTIVESVIGVVGVIGYLVYLSVQAAATGSSLAASPEGMQSMLMNSGFLAMLQQVATAAVTVIALVWYYFGFVKKEKAEGKVNRIAEKMKNPYSIGLVVFGSVALWFLASVMQVAGNAIFPTAGEFLNNIISGIMSDNFFLNFLLFAILAPISEELFIRGIILRKAEKAYGIIGCVILSAVMFAVFHMNPIQSIYVLPMGAFLGYIGVKYHSVIPCILVHMISNTLAITVPGVLKAEEYIWLYCIVAVVAGAATYFFVRKAPFAEKEA